MTYECQFSREPNSQSRPRIISYDSGYEHSIEHLIELRMMVEYLEEEEEVFGRDRDMAVCA